MYTLLSLLLLAQVRPLHTRDLTRLSEPQVQEQLKRSDVIYIPVGAVETNGTQPSGRDYVYPLAYAMTMAEQSGGLYMPGLMWSYPGTTSWAKSSIYLSPEGGRTFLKQLAHSLLRQGFRRQVYLSASHGPAALTVGSMVREFFEETRVPILYIDMDKMLPRLQVTAEDRRLLLYGAHAIAGRLEDLPLKGDYGAEVEKAPEGLPENDGLRDLGRLGLSGSLNLGSWVSHPMAHGGGGPLPANAAERERWSQQGKDRIQKLVREMKMPEAMDALRRHDAYTQKWIVPQLR